MYRSPILPRFFRNLDLAAPVVTLLLLPSIVGAALFLGSPFDEGIPYEVRAIGLVGAGYFLFSLAASMILLYRPPARLIPSWLEEDNREVGYVPPAPTPSDRFWLMFIAGPSIICGAAAVALGASIYIGRS